MKRIILLVAVILLAVGGAVGITYFADFQKQQPTSLTYDEETVVSADSMEISFNYGDTFYSEALDVQITCADSGAKLYYTTNGDTPTESSKLYSEKIKIPSRSTVNATTIKVIAVNGEKKSDVITKTYITGKNVFERFDENTLVFVLSSDSYNLYDYYYGVLVEGFLRDQYLNSDEYNGGELDYTAPANWYIRGRESEREMYVEVYDCKGNQLISQAAGGRVVGGASRANTQKSWRLIARTSYSPDNGKFKYPFFYNEQAENGDFITRYDRVTLRDNANDREFASIRDEVSQRLAEMAGFPDTQATRPAAVFLNSEYYGFAWLHEAFGEDYLATNYGGNRDNFYIIGNKEGEMEIDEDSDTDEEKKAVEDWNYILDIAYGNQDINSYNRDENGEIVEDAVFGYLTDDAVFDEFCSLVDIDDFMLYYAMQIYIDNKDWPGNNYKAWRYYPSENETVTGEYLDGKWRFLWFDVEYAWGLYGSGYKDKTLTNVLTGNHMQGASKLLKALLERDDMREKFANTMCDLMYGAFSTENALAVIEQCIKESDSECMYALKNGYTSTWANEWTFEDSRQQIRDFADRRPTIMTRNLCSEFGIEDAKYNITLNNPTGAKSYLNSQALTESGAITLSYFTAYEVPLTFETYGGYAFNHWEVNGVDYAEEKLVVNYGMADENGNVNVKLYLDKTDVSGGLVISEVYTSGNGDWVELYNSSDKTLSTKDYFLSDDFDRLDRFNIPTTAIAPKSTLTIAMKNNKENSALMKIAANFNLKTGETVYLSDSEGNILSKCGIVEMEADQSASLGIDGKYHIGNITEGYH